MKAFRSVKDSVAAPHPKVIDRIQVPASCFTDTVVANKVYLVVCAIPRMEIRTQLKERNIT